MKQSWLYCALLAASLTAHAADWSIFDISTGTPKVITLIDDSSIRTEGRFVKAWILDTGAELRARGRYRYRSAKTQVIAECGPMKFGLKQRYYYDRAGGEGKVVDSFSDSDAQVELMEPPPDTVGAGILAYVCQRAK